MTRGTPQPEHGTPARYRGTRTGSRPPCPCRRCVDAHTKACALRDLARTSGTGNRIPSAPVTRHVKALLAVGMSCTQISIAAGVSVTSVNNAAHGRNPTFNRGVAEKILAVRPCIVRPTDRVPAYGTRRRLQALYCIGHGPAAIAAATGLTLTGIQHIVYRNAPVVTAATYTSVKAAYRQLAGKPGASIKARSSGRRNDWAPAPTWDDDTIDNPDTIPEWTGHCGTDRGWWTHRLERIPVCQACDAAHAAWKAEHQALPQPEFMTALGRARGAAANRGISIAHDGRELLAQGHDLDGAAARIGITKAYLQQELKRHPAPAGEAVAA